MSAGFDAYLKRVGRHKQLPLDQERVLAERMGRGDQQAREKLIMHNLWLCVEIAKDFAGSGVEFEDIVQAGSIGLLEGLEQYDPQRDTAVATYVRQYIRKAIKKMILLEQDPVPIDPSVDTEGLSDLTNGPDFGIVISREQEIIRALHRLVPQERSAYLMSAGLRVKQIAGEYSLERWEEPKSLREIANVLGISYGQVKILIDQAADKIRKRLGGEL